MLHAPLCFWRYALCADSVCTLKCSLALQVGPLLRALSLLVVSQLVKSLCCLCINVQQQGLIAAQTAAQGGVLILASQDARCHDRFSQVCLQLALITTTAGVCFGKYLKVQHLAPMQQSFCKLSLVAPSRQVCLQVALIRTTSKT